MAFTHRLRTLWNREAPQAPVRTLAMMALAGGLCCLFAAEYPANPAAPVGLLRACGVVAIIGSAAIRWIGNRMPAWGLQAAMAIGTAGTSLIVTRSATGLGMIVTACGYLWIGVYAAFFFSQGAARAHMVLIAATFGLALLLSDKSVPLAAWVFMTASLVIAGETIGRQSALLRREAHSDSLTGLLNRKGLAIAAERALSLADRTGIALTAAIVDLDGFKQINDRDGHLAGDRILVDLTRAWSAELEPSDIFARLGGDEFLLLLVGSGAEESARLLERLRFVSPTPWSAGVVGRQRGEDLSSCLSRADSALYQAKRERRVRSESARPAAASNLVPRPSRS